MAVRRLADDHLQPETFAFSAKNKDVVAGWIAKYPDGRQASAVIPLLMIAQEQEGWVTRASIEHVAQVLDMPYIRVLEVATFYTQFMLKPVGKKAHIQVCGTTPCMLRGSEALMQVCKARIHPEQFETDADGALSWEEVECQGACVNAPMVMIFKDTYEDLTAERLGEIIDAFAAGEGDAIAPGPQIDRIYSAPTGGLTCLTDEPGIEHGPNGATPVETSSAPIAEQKPTEGGQQSGENRPPVMDKPDKPDNLKLISGIGPKLEGVLNGLGIYTFEQIAGWTAQECEWVDGYLKFKGRISRDAWTRQAAALAEGGEAEYARIFGRKPG